MPTPEEELAATKAKLAEAQDQIKASESLSDRLAEQKKTMDDMVAAGAKKDLAHAKIQAISQYGNLKGIENIDRMIVGDTPEKMAESAKSISESLGKRDTAFKEQNEKENELKWKQLPGSMPSSVALTKDRQDEYIEARKIPDKRTRIKTLMGMHVIDLARKTNASMRRNLGLDKI